MKIPHRTASRPPKSGLATRLDVTTVSRQPWARPPSSPAAPAPTTSGPGRDAHGSRWGLGGERAARV